MTEEKTIEFYREIGARIEKARERERMKPEILGQHLGLTRQSVINIEKGRHKPSIHTLLEIAILLKIHYTKLIPETGSKKSKVRQGNMHNVVTDTQSLNKGTKEALKKFISAINQPTKKNT